MKHENAGIDAALQDIAGPTTQHTPGPWLLREDAGQINIADPTRNWDMCNITMRHAPTIDQAQANARLIAAAPDLLAALATVEARLTAAARAFYVVGKQGALADALAGWKVDAEAARAAIAKATGAA